MIFVLSDMLIIDLLNFVLTVYLYHHLSLQLAVDAHQGIPVFWCYTIYGSILSIYNALLLNCAHSPGIPLQAEW